MPTPENLTASLHDSFSATASTLLDLQWANAPTSVKTPQFSLQPPTSWEPTALRSFALKDSRKQRHIFCCCNYAAPESNCTIMVISIGREFKSRIWSSNVTARLPGDFSLLIMRIRRWGHH